jgi:hypothetical protein
MEDYKYLNTPVVIKNCITLICFTILAIIFKHWWIVLFSALFTVSIKKDKED